MSIFCNYVVWPEGICSSLKSVDYSEAARKSTLRQIVSLSQVQAKRFVAHKDNIPSMTRSLLDPMSSFPHVATSTLWTNVSSIKLLTVILSPFLQILSCNGHIERTNCPPGRKFNSGNYLLSRAGKSMLVVCSFHRVLHVRLASMVCCFPAEHASNACWWLMLNHSRSSMSRKLTIIKTWRKACWWRAHLFLVHIGKRRDHHVSEAVSNTDNLVLYPSQICVLQISTCQRPSPQQWPVWQTAAWMPASASVFHTALQPCLAFLQ